MKKVFLIFLFSILLIGGCTNDVPLNEKNKITDFLKKKGFNPTSLAYVKGNNIEIMINNDHLRTNVNGIWIGTAIMGKSAWQIIIPDYENPQIWKLTKIE